MFSGFFFWIFSLLALVITVVVIYSSVFFHPAPKIKPPLTRSKIVAKVTLPSHVPVVGVHVLKEGRKKQSAPEDIYSAFAEGAFVPEQPEETTSEAKITLVPSRLNLEIGVAAGFYSAATTALLELRWPLPYVFGLATTSLRFSCGLAQSEDTSRRYVPVQFDAIFNLPAGYLTGVENYLGCGLNYVLLTSGRVPGSFGGQVFYGLQSEGFYGKIFAEMGYGILRTGFSPSYRGVTLMMGYRQKVTFW